MDLTFLNGDWDFSDDIDPERNSTVIYVWTAVFIILLMIHTRYTIQGVCRQKEMQNIYNILLTSCIYLLLMIHTGCFIHSLVKMDYFNDNQIRYFGVQALTIEYYFYYQLPFDLLNIAIITHIYQWLEIKHTLIYCLDMLEYRQDDDEDGSEIKDRSIKTNK